jgi:hypothetical protein
MRSPKKMADITMPITLIAVNGNTAAWLGGAKCKAPNISMPNSGPANTETASQMRHCARIAGHCRKIATAKIGSVINPATAKRKKVKSQGARP